MPTRTVRQCILSKTHSYIAMTNPLDDESQYSCLLCPSHSNVSTMSFVPFKRHVHASHYPLFMFQCPVKDCTSTFCRKEDLARHLRSCHQGRPTLSELDLAQRAKSPPTICPICSCDLDSWASLWACLLKHCLCTN